MKYHTYTSILFVTAMRYPSWGLFRALNTRTASFFGTLSYSLYLVHHVILGTIEAHVPLPGIARALLAFALSTALSWAIYQVIEKPCARNNQPQHSTPTFNPASGRVTRLRLVSPGSLVSNKIARPDRFKRRGLLSRIALVWK